MRGTLLLNLSIVDHPRVREGIVRHQMPLLVTQVLRLAVHVELDGVAAAALRLRQW